MGHHKLRKKFIILLLLIFAIVFFLYKGTSNIFGINIFRLIRPVSNTCGNPIPQFIYVFLKDGSTGADANRIIQKFKLSTMDITGRLNAIGPFKPQVDTAFTFLTPGDVDNQLKQDPRVITTFFTDGERKKLRISFSEGTTRNYVINLMVKYKLRITIDHLSPFFEVKVPSGQENEYINTIKSDKQVKMVSRTYACYF